MILSVSIFPLALSRVSGETKPASSLMVHHLSSFWSACNLALQEVWKSSQALLAITAGGSECASL